MLTAIAELAARIDDPDWVVVDCRFNLAQPDAGEAAYRGGHIPGAHYAHLDRDLSAPRAADTGRHPLPDPDRLRESFSRWGIGSASHVVAYDDIGGAFAARLWWLLRWMGHGQASLLDGGLGAWLAAGLPLSIESPQRRAAHFVGYPGHMPTVTTAELQRRLGAPGLRLLDARAANRFHGRDENIDPVAGHVPGAISAPFQGNLTASGAFRSSQELKERFSALTQGHDNDGLVSMCGSGVTACHNIFAMELAGIRNVRLYPGSWSEWIRSPDRPVATD